MTIFDQIEEHRDLVAGLEYEDSYEGVDEKLAWKRAVVSRDAACVVYHHCEGELQAHHVITQQHLRKRGLGNVLWDRRIGVTVCEKAHRRHTLAIERIPRDCLPVEVETFVQSLELGWMLERYYGVAG